MLRPTTVTRLRTHMFAPSLLLLLLPCRYGFQRIVPSVDLMAAKQYYTTTIVGMWYLWGCHENLCCDGMRRIMPPAMKWYCCARAACCVTHHHHHLSLYHAPDS